MQETFEDLECRIKKVSELFSTTTQEFVLKLHHCLINFGFKCEIKTKRYGGIGNYFLYSYKGKQSDDIWIIIKINPDDCAIRIGSKSACHYAAIVERFPSSILDVIIHGTGCIHNPTPKKCQVETNGNIFLVKEKKYIKCIAKWCAECNFWITLTKLTKQKSQAIEKWIEMELAYRSDWLPKFEEKQKNNS